MAKQTPFIEEHRKLGAKITEFAGFVMPVSYSGIKDEHLAVRNYAGLFDVSHMGEFIVEGSEAADLIQYVITNDVTKLKPGKALYTVMCNEFGGIVDDMIVYMLDENRFMMVVNAANREKDYNWIAQHNTYSAKVFNRSDEMCLLAVQGPKSIGLLQQLTELDLSNIRFYTFDRGNLGDQRNIIFSATGYTGEKGFELYFDKNEADPAKIWNMLMETGQDEQFNLKPAGLGARDTLRLEAGLALYGNDLNDQTTPLEARLGWLTKLGKGFFIGKEALEKTKAQGIKRKLMGFEVTEGKALPRKDHEIYSVEGEAIGKVTSGTRSISLGKNIGMGYVQTPFAGEGTPVIIKVRNKEVKAEIVKPPFIG